MSGHSISHAHRQTYARLAGAAYLMIFILAIAANFGVLMSLLVEDNPAATLDNILARNGAFRLALIAMFFVMIADLLVAWALYCLFESEDRPLSLLSTLFRVAYTVAHIPVLLTLVSALRLAEADWMEPAQQAGLVHTLLLAHNDGFLVTLIFFGVHLILLGVLILSTQVLPKLIGGLVAIAGLGYVLDGLLFFLAPDLRPVFLGGPMVYVILPALIGEAALTLRLLFFNVRSVPS